MRTPSRAKVVWSAILTLAPHLRGPREEEVWAVLASDRRRGPLHAAEIAERINSSCPSRDHFDRDSGCTCVGGGYVADVLRRLEKRGVVKATRFGPLFGRDRTH